MKCIKRWLGVLKNGGPVKGFFQITSISYSNNASSLFKSRIKFTEEANIRIRRLIFCENIEFVLGIQDYILETNKDLRFDSHFL